LGAGRGANSFELNLYMIINMARLQVADGDVIQIWETAANILDKSISEQPTRGGPLTWMLGGGLTTPRRKNTVCYER
jgi:hypothetical protein